MLTACRNDGSDYGYYDNVRLGYVRCAERPEGQVFTGTVSTDPSVMWRPKTAQEIQDELDVKAVTDFTDLRLTRAVAIWVANRLGVSLATARNEIIAIYKGL